MKSRIFACVAVAAMTLVTTTAFAGDARYGYDFKDDLPAATPKAEEGYGYDFKDDILSAPGGWSTAPLIRLMPGPVRRTLIRPRTSFVPELFMSTNTI